MKTFSRDKFNRPVIHVTLPLWHGPFLRSSEQFFITEASGGVVIDHAAGLHVGVTDGRSDESKSPFAQIPAHRGGFLGFRRKFWPLKFVDLRFMPHKLPDIFIERSEFLLYFQKSLGVFHGGFNFKPVADDAGVF